MPALHAQGRAAAPSLPSAAVFDLVAIPAPEDGREGGVADVREKRSGHKRRRGDDSNNSGGSVARGAVPEALTLEDARRQIDLLTSENTALRAQLRAVSQATSKDSITQERERQRQLGRIRALAAAGDDEVRHAVVRYKDVHSDFGKDRWVALRHHLSCLRSLLTPSLITKVCTWGIEAQGAAGGASAAATAAATAAGGTPAVADVWAGVAEHARLDGEQRRRILGLRDAARARRADFEVAVGPLQALEEATTRSFTGLEGHMNRLMGSISPVQIALVLDWVDRNASVLAAIAPLNAWPHQPGVEPLAGKSSSSATGPPRSSRT